MAQFDFYGSRKDGFEILKCLLEQGEVIFVADIWYDMPVPLIIRRIDDEVAEILNRRPRVYVFPKGAMLQRCGFVQQDAGPCAGKFSIELDMMGQGLELTLPACYEESGMLNLSCGMAAYPRQFYSEKHGQWEKPGEEIKSAYSIVCKCIKKLSRRQMLISKSGWVGSDAAELLRSGKARIVDKGV
jgi:hypothetical protein